MRDSRLKSHAPRIIELLYPAARYPDIAPDDRAIATEKIIVAAVDSLGEGVSHSLSILLCLTPGTLGLTLQQRRQMAAEHVGVLPATWERGWREPQLLADLAARIYRLHQTNPHTYIPAPIEPA